MKRTLLILVALAIVVNVYGRGKPENAAEKIMPTSAGELPVVEEKTTLHVLAGVNPGYRTSKQITRRFGLKKKQTFTSSGKR